MSSPERNSDLEELEVYQLSLPGSSTPQHDHRRPSIGSCISSVRSLSSRSSFQDAEESMQEVPQMGRTSTSRCQKSLKTLQTMASKRIDPSARRSLEQAFTKAAEEDESSTFSLSELSADLSTPKRRKQIYQGKEWKLFQPKHKGRLYEAILSDPDGTFEVANKWVKCFKKDEPQALVELFQFLADVSAFQNFDLASVVQIDKVNYREVVLKMEQNCPLEMKQKCNYLLKSTSEWAKQIQNSIYDFLKDLIVIVNRTESFKDALKHLVAFLSLMALSSNKALHHTGVVLIAKLNTVLLEICSKIYVALKKLVASPTISTSLQEKKNRLTQAGKSLSITINVLEAILKPNFELHDPSIEMMRITCVAEMPNWFTVNPLLISSTDYINLLLKLVEDQYPNVRATALQTCHTLLETDKFSNDLTYVIKKMMCIIGERVYDVDVQISIAAIKIHTCISKTYLRAINTASRHRIILMIFDKDNDLAKAAGEFFVRIIRDGNSYAEEKTASIIKNLISFCNLHKKSERIPLVIEAIMHCCPEVQNWEIMIDLLLSESLFGKDEQTLIDIIFHAIYPVLTGRVNLGRTMHVTKAVNAKSAMKASKVFLSKLYVLLRRYSSTDHGQMQQITEILSIIDFSDTFLQKYTKDIFECLRILRPVFVDSLHAGLLQSISKVFERLCSDSSIFRTNALYKYSTLRDAIVESCLKAFEELGLRENSSQSSLLKLETSILKLVVLSADHDVTELIQPEVVFDTWLKLEEGVVTNKTMKSIVLFAYWYVIWRMRAIIKNYPKGTQTQELRQNVNTLQYTCNGYLQRCFEILSIFQSDEVKTEACRCVCNLHVTFHRELKGPAAFNGLLKQLIPDTPTASQVSVLMAYSEKILFREMKRDSLENRRLHLGSLISMVNLSIIRIAELAVLYQYYLAFNDDYGDIISASIQSFRNHDNVWSSGLIYHTMKYCFGKIPEENLNTSRLQNKKVDDLRKLAKRFQQLILRSPDDIKIVLLFSISYALGSPDRYKFLFFIRSFGSHLSVKDRKATIEFLRARIPKGQENNELIQGFISYLQNKSRGRPVHRASVSTTSTNTEVQCEETDSENESYSIEEYNSEEVDEDLAS